MSLRSCAEIARNGSPARSRRVQGGATCGRAQVYVVYFKCNKQFIHQYPNMREYVKEVYAMPGVTESINMWHIKTHYFTSHPRLNYYGVVPLGCEEWWTEPHNRGETHPVSS